MKCISEKYKISDLGFCECSNGYYKDSSNSDCLKCHDRCS
jgi:hypothetical protein